MEGGYALFQSQNDKTCNIWKLVSATTTFSPKLVVGWRRLSRFPAKMTLIHARTHYLVLSTRTRSRSRLRTWRSLIFSTLKLRRGLGQCCVELHDGSILETTSLHYDVARQTGPEFVPKIEVLNGVNRQSSNGLKCNRQPSKKVIFYCHKYKLILTFKEFQGISNLTSADLHGLLAPEESLNFSTFSKHSF